MELKNEEIREALIDLRAEQIVNSSLVNSLLLLLKGMGADINVVFDSCRQGFEQGAKEAPSEVMTENKQQVIDRALRYISERQSELDEIEVKQSSQSGA